MDNLRLVSVTGQTHHRGFLAGPQQAAVVAEGGHGRDGARYAVLATTAADDGPQLTHALARRLPLGHRAEAGALIVVKRQSLGRGGCGRGARPTGPQACRRSAASPIPPGIGANYSRKPDRFYCLIL